MHNSCNLGVNYLYTLDSVSGTDSDDGETDLLELLSVQHQSTAVMSATVWARGRGSRGDLLKDESGSRTVGID
jgi:hypothetical protein